MHETVTRSFDRPRPTGAFRALFVVVLVLLLTVMVGCSPDGPVGPTPVSTSIDTSSTAPTPDAPGADQSPEPPVSPAPPVDAPDHTETPAPPDERPVPPPPPPPPPPIVEPGTPTVTNPKPPQPHCAGLGVFVDSNNHHTWTITNHAPYSCTWTAVTWILSVPYPQPGWTNQTFWGWSEVTVAPGQTGSVTTPNAPCGTHWQTDLYPASQQELGPNAQLGDPANLIIVNIAHGLGVNPACPPPPPPPNSHTTSASVDAVCVPNGQTFQTKLTAGNLRNATLQVSGPTSPQSLTLTSTAPMQMVAWPVGTYTWTARAIQTPAVWTTPTSGTLTIVDCSPPPPPLTCAETNPERVTTHGRVTTTYNQHQTPTVTVTVDYTYANIQGQSVGIWWKNGSEGWVKDAKLLTVACEEGMQSGTLVWSSSQPLHQHDHGAQYAIIRFTGTIHPTALTDPSVVSVQWIDVP